MKIQKILSFLLAGVLLGRTVPAFGMDIKPLWPLIAGGTISGILYAKKCIQCHRVQQVFEKDKQDLTKLHPVKLPACVASHENTIQDSLREKAKENHGIEDVTFLPWHDENIKEYATAYPQNIIYMPQNAYITLLYENHPRCKMQTQTGVINDQLASWTHLHIEEAPIEESIVIGTNILNHIHAQVEHELGHIKHHSAIKKIRLAYTWPMIAGVSSTLASLALKNSSLITKCLAYWGITGLSYGVNQVLNIAYGKYDETRADDAMPNDQNLLKIAMYNHRAHHAAYVNAAKTNPSLFDNSFERCMASTMPSSWWTNYPLLAAELLRANDEHPSDYFRAQRFENRLAALKNKAKEESNEK